jgi:1-acyl-sn-glycerol-3-phosphate acyltransferase
MSNHNIFAKIKLLFRIIPAALGTAYYALKAYFVIRNNPDKSQFYIYSTRWSFFLLKLFNVRVTVTGYDQLSPDQTYIFASNHSSLFDIPILFNTLKHNYVIIYKRELEKIPLFGRILKFSPFIAVDRDDPRNAMNSIDTALSTLDKNVSVIIFPEGTRSEDGKLGSFKRGAFLIASRSGKPIVPVTVNGSSLIMPARTFKVQGGDIKVILDNPIENNGNLSKVEEKAMMELVRNRIESNLSI